MAERLLGPYRLMEILSEHATGALWRAWDTQLNRRVVVRRLPRLDRTNEDGGVLFKAFLRDVSQLALLRHPSLLAPVGFSPPHASEAYYATELHDVPNLHVLVSTVGLLPWAQGLLILQQLAEALDHAHGRGIFHGSVSPACVLLDPRGRVYLTDFNISLAALVRTNVAAFEGLGRVVDDRAYVAPEVLRLRPPSAAGDIFSLGVVAFEMLTGVRPFADATAVRTHGETRHAPAPDPWDVAGHLPPAARDLVREMLASAPEDRPPSMAVVAERAAEALEPEDRADPTQALRASFGRQSMVFGGLDAAHAEEDLDPARRKTAPMMPATSGDVRDGAAAGGGVPRRKTVPGIPGKGEAPGTPSDSPSSPARRKTERFAPPQEGATGGSRGAPPGKHKPTAATRALRILEQEGYLRPPSKPERDSTRAIALVMALALAAALGVWFVLLERGPRPGDGPPPAAGVSTASRPATTASAAPEVSPADRAQPPPEAPVDVTRAKAQALLQAHNPKRAIEQARAGLALAPDDPGLARVLIEALLAAGERDAAVEALVEQDRKAGPAAWRGFARAAALRLADKRFEEARELLQAALDRGADDPGLWRSLARAERALGHPRAAATALRRYLEDRPNDVKALGELAKVQEELGDRAGALAAYRRILALRPGDPVASSAALRLGGAAELPRAAAAARAPNASPETLEAAGYAALRGKRYDVAVRTLRRALALRRAAGTAPPWAVVYNYALALDQGGRPEEAVPVYQRLLADKPDSAAVAELLGRALLRVGKTADAERALARAAALAPSKWKARFALGRLALERGDWTAAQRAFQAVLKVAPGQPEALQNLGKAQIERKDYGGALKTFQRLGEVRPADPQPVLTVAKLLTMMRRASDAAPWWAEACRRGSREACEAQRRGAAPE